MIVVVLAFASATYTARLYNNYYTVDFGGVVGLWVGFIVSFLFILGFVVGFNYINWYQRIVLLIFTITAVLYSVQSVFTYTEARALDLVLLLGGYILGLGVRKLTAHLKNKQV